MFLKNDESQNFTGDDLHLFDLASKRYEKEESEMDSMSIYYLAFIRLTFVSICSLWSALISQMSRSSVSPTPIG